MPTGQVKLDVRITPANRAKLDHEARRLKRRVKLGVLSPQIAMQQMSELNQELTEWRIDGGSWRSLKEA